MHKRTEIENLIKKNSDKNWLCPSQLVVLSEIEIFIGGFHRVLNIYGNPGVGKTFLSHIIFKLDVASYITSVDDLSECEKTLIVDNAPFERSRVRNLRNAMRKFGLHQVILVSRYRAEDDIPSFKLHLTKEDIRYFRGNLHRHFGITMPKNDSVNLWDHMKQIGDRDAKR